MKNLLFRMMIVPAIGMATTVCTNAQVLTPIDGTGWNYQYVIPATGPLSSHTGTQDQGANNGGSTFYEKGLNTSSPSSGLAMGQTFTSGVDANTTFQFRPAGGNDVLAFDSNATTPNTVTFTLSNPGTLTQFALLSTAGGDAVGATVTVNFSDATSQVFNFTVYDWFSGDSQAYIAGPDGRVDLPSGPFNGGGDNPKLHQSADGPVGSDFRFDLDLANQSKIVTSMTFNRLSGGIPAIYAISGDITAVPEPGTLGLAALGCAGLFAVIRRRSQRLV